MEVYAWQLLNDKSDVRGMEELMEAVQVYLSSLESQRWKQLPDVYWDHVVCHLFKRFRNMQRPISVRYIVY